VSVEIAKGKGNPERKEIQEEELGRTELFWKA